MMERTRKFFTILGLAVVVSAFGTFTGSALHSETVIQPVAAACEEDECEGGTDCVNNAGGNTACSVNSSGGCDTSGCGTALQ